MIGQTIAHYRILEQLGQGGMGVVYKAEDTKLQRLVALKFLPESFRALPEARAQLLNEARAASRLTHPNIVTVYSVEESDAGDFIVMEYVEGGTLRSRKEDVTLDQMVDMMIQAAGGLGAAHEHNIIHRDIKPENLLVDTVGHVKVSDFGLARVFSGSQRSFHTRTIAGTPAYMAPEQVLGESIDARTDIFCLGAVFYEIISGHRPFEGDHDMAVLYAVVSTPHTSLGDFDRSVPDDLSSIIDRCLAKAPAQRFDNCGQLVAALEEVRRGVSIPYGILTKSPSGPRAWHQIVGQPSTQLVGRGTEVEAIKQHLELLKSGQGHLLFFTGESGVGKTRLAEWTLREAGETGMGILSGRCLPHGGGFPYHPYASALRSGFPRLDDLAIRPLADRAVALGIDLMDRLPILKTFLNMSGGAAAVINQEQLWDSLLVLFRLIAFGQPLVLLLDDLQWADEDTLKFMSFLAHSIDDLPLLQLGTYRPIEPNESPPSAKIGLTDVVRQLHKEGKADVVELLRLMRNDAFVLALQYMGNAPRPDSADVIARRSDGNPLFVKELTEFMKRSDALEPQTGDDLSSAAGLEPAIPSRVRDIIAQRIEGLGAPERELLELASCEPEFFESQILLQCLKAERIALLRRLQMLESGHRLIRHAGARYRFDHPLIREVVYNGILPELRAAYHGMIAAVLVERQGESGEHASRIAHHFLASGQTDEAVAHLFIAAERARDLCANSEASRLYYELEAIISTEGGIDPDSELRLKMGFGDVLLAEGMTSQAQAHYEQGLQAARARGERGLSVDFLRRLSVPYRMLGDLETALRTAQSAADEALTIGDEARRIECLATLAMVHVPRAEYGCTVELATEVLVLAEKAGDIHHQSVALALMGAAHLHQGEYRQSADYLERAIAMQRSIGDQRGLAASLNFSGLAYHRLAQFSRSIHHHQESLRIKRAIQDVSAIPGSLNALGDVYRDMGQLALALENHTQSLEMARRHSNRGAECDSLRDLGGDYTLLGRTDEAERSLREVARLAQEHKYPWYETRAFSALSELSLQSGSLSRATEFSQRALRLARQVNAAELLAEALHAHARVLSETEGAATEAIDHVREAIAVAEAGSLILPLWPMYLLMAQLLARTDDLGAAKTTYRQAHGHLQNAAAGIDDPQMRQTFLDLPQARAILAATD